LYIVPTFIVIPPPTNYISYEQYSVPLWGPFASEVKVFPIAKAIRASEVKVFPIAKAIRAPEVKVFPIAKAIRAP
jgi:hypothetical protein